MARTRHKKNSTPSRPARKAPAHYDEKYNSRIRELRKSGIKVDPTNRKQVNAKYRAIVAQKTREDNYSIPADKETRANLKKRGFVVSKKGVLIDKPRDGKRELIKGVKTTITKDGIVKFSAGQRSDYIIGLTRKEKKEYAQNPELITKQILERLKAQFPTVKKSKSRQVRLQWGIFRGNKTFSGSHFSKKYFEQKSPDSVRKVGRKKAKQKIDNLTGLHFVIHSSGKGNDAKKKTAKRKAPRKKAAAKK